MHCQGTCKSRAGRPILHDEEAGQTRVLLADLLNATVFIAITKMAEVVLDDGHTYSLAELPSVNSPVVIREQARLLGAINLEALVDDLERLGKCIGIAYHGVNGIEELQIEIQQVCYDITKLCDKSAVAVKNFKNVLTASLSSLNSTYEFLMNSSEELAIATLAHVNDEVMQMGNTAEELRKEFDNQAEKLIIALDKTENFENADKYEITRTLVDSLKSLSAVMMQAALFWYQLQEHCEHLAKGEMKEMIEKALKYDEDRRLKFWNSKGFKSKAIQYYAGWVALDHVCGIYMERIMLTQRELYTYIQEALRPEEAREKVKELAKNFGKDLETQQKAIADRKEEQLKEMEELTRKAEEEEAKKKNSGK